MKRNSSSAAIATVLPLVDGGPRKLVHGVFSTITKSGVLLPEIPALPEATEARWEENWGEEMVEAAAHAIAAPPPLDLTLADPAATGEWAEKLGGISLLPGHVRLPSGNSVMELQGFDEGAWWVQDLAASLPARLLGPGAGRRAGRRAIACAASRRHRWRPRCASAFRWRR